MECPCHPSGGYFWPERWHCHLQSQQAGRHWAVIPASAEPGSVWQRQCRYITVSCLVEASRTCLSQSSSMCGALCVARGWDTALLSVSRAGQVPQDMFIAHQHSWEPSLIAAFFDPHTWTLVQLGGFSDSWSRKLLCFQKKRCPLFSSLVLLYSRAVQSYPQEPL